MVSTVLNNLLAFAASMPTNMVILVLICLILHFLFGYSIKSCIKVIIGYLLIGLLLGLFGITMPSFLAIGQYIAGMLKSLW